MQRMKSSSGGWGAPERCIVSTTCKHFPGISSSLSKPPSDANSFLICWLWVARVTCRPNVTALSRCLPIQHCSNLLYLVWGWGRRWGKLSERGSCVITTLLYIWNYWWLNSYWLSLLALAQIFIKVQFKGAMCKTSDCCAVQHWCFRLVPVGPKSVHIETFNKMSLPTVYAHLLASCTHEKRQKTRYERHLRHIEYILSTRHISSSPCRHYNVQLRSVTY